MNISDILSPKPDKFPRTPTYKTAVIDELGDHVEKKIEEIDET